MEYLIAGIRIDIPHRFTTGAFGMALAPFALSLIHISEPTRH